MFRQKYRQWLVIVVMAAGFLCNSCLGTFAASAPAEKAFLGMTPDEIYKELGEPHYIRVIDYGAGVRYAYFTPDEWARIADMAPLEQGMMFMSEPLEGLRGSTILVILQPT